MLFKREVKTDHDVDLEEENRNYLRLESFTVAGKDDPVQLSPTA